MKFNSSGKSNSKLVGMSLTAAAGIMVALVAVAPIAGANASPAAGPPGGSAGSSGSLGFTPFGWQQQLDGLRSAFGSGSLGGIQHLPAPTPHANS
ncbi:hypothetical protein JMUB6875_31860 [Nocardia sp. JMUB6875]